MVLLILLRKKYLCGVVWCAVAVLLIGLLDVPRPLPVFSPVYSTAPAVVIDPGHGGEDGGAVAADGTVESHINLAVSLRLREVLFLLGIQNCMTREGETSLASTEAVTLREKKRSDLENRAAFINRYPEAALISIHQNSLPSVPSVCGAQVFYGIQQGSAALAAELQEQLNYIVNTDKAKTSKAIDGTIYLMKHVENTAVLVECGFLSNSLETEKLRQNEHQIRLALSIAAGFLKWRNST